MATLHSKKLSSRKSRHLRVRKKIYGTAKRPRLSVFRSNQHIYAQLIDDNLGKTLIAASDKEIKAGPKKGVDVAKETGKLIAGKAKDKKIKEVVFDRSGFKFYGRVKAFAQGAREGGLKF